MLRDMLSPVAIIISISLAAVLGTAVAEPAGEGRVYAVNIIENGSFAQIGDDGAAHGWNLTGNVTAAADTEQARAGEAAYRLEIPARASASLSQELEVEPHEQYFFSAWVRSNGRVVADMATLSASYHRQGEWQKLAGVAISDDSGIMTLQFSCRPLEEGPQQVWIDDVVVGAAERPELPDYRRDLSRTALVDGAEPAVTIVYPSEGDTYRVMADAVAHALREATGVDAPVITDVEATEAGPPVLKDELRETNLILIGRLGINRAMWPAYNRFLCATDGYYPGGDGYVVRTAADIDGYNHIILGGSSDAGAQRATDRFVEMLPEIVDDGALPYLLDVELGGDCLAKFEERDALWRDNPHASILPPVQPGYGSVRRWYENAMGYYWSGWDSYRERADRKLEAILDDRAYTHHYIAEFFVRCARMLAHSPAISDEQRRALDDLILENFWEFMYGRDVIWFFTVSPPYSDIRIIGRHTTAPLMMEVVMTDYLYDRLDLEGDIGDIVAFRRSEKFAFMDSMVAERAGPSAPVSGPGGAHEELILTLFRYALEHERYEFFENGNAREALHIDRIDHRSGFMVRPSDRPDNQHILGILAHYYRDGRYVSLAEILPRNVARAGDFMGRYIYDVHRYTPGDEIAPESLESLVGMRMPPTLPHVQQHLSRVGTGSFHTTSLDPEEIFDFAAFRGGFTPDDDYLSISGIAMGGTMPGAIIGLSSDRRHWLRTASDSYFGHNGLHVLRTDRFAEEDKPYPAVARLDWSHEFDGGGALAFTLEPFVETAWQRSVVWVNPGLFVIRDRVTPTVESGEYLLSINWHLQGVVREEDGHYTLINGPGRMRISTLGEGVRTTQMYDDDRSMSYLRLIRTGEMEVGETATLTTVLQVARDGAPNYTVTQIASDRLLLLPDDESGEAIAVSCPADGDAPMTVMQPSAEQIERAIATREAAAEADAADELQIRDDQGRWRASWEYDGLLRPARIQPARRVSDELVDLGRVVRLDEIRTVIRGPWAPSEIPGPIYVAVPDAEGNMPPLDGDGWEEVTTEPVWREGIRTGNYGEAVPVEQVSQYLPMDGKEVRYVRASNVDILVFYDQENHEARRPMTLLVQDHSPDGDPAIVVRPRPYPRFYRGWQLEDDAFALLAPDGTERIQHEPPQRIQEVRLVDYFGTGQKQLLMATVNARIQIFDIDGQRLRDIDMYQMHQHFEETEGRPNTRHPAGLYTMPYSVGLWQRGEDGTAKLAVARYQALSFIDDKAEFEGVLHVSGAVAYVMQQMLPEGFDFTGDGRDEQIGLSHGFLWRISGDNTPYVTEPDGALFYPQVYRSQPLAEPARIGSIEGPPTYIFEQVLLDGGPQRYLVVTRSNYVGLYDGQEHGWAFSWVPLVEMNSAALWYPSETEVEVSALTNDGVLWTFRWDGDLAAEPQRSLQSVEIDGRVTGMAATSRGDLLFAATDGLLLHREGELSLIASGGFVDVAVIGDPAGDAVIATRADGTVLRLDPLP